MERPFVIIDLPDPGLPSSLASVTLLRNTQPLMNAWRRLRVLVLAIGVPATGNHVTARRIRRALALKSNSSVIEFSAQGDTTNTSLSSRGGQLFWSDAHPAVQPAAP